ncbi:DUF3152 domain-containing protein [Streptomyces sp. PCS3-D2]|uniref:DUF3152 domain-containing protein n=1 Tax=Streptomyces sp. PCS3-D2 TaxID=1460244 RepID=UPI000451972D|nr:DUF3152 domain-containing protein [Streptomyces sp. PCS3-D2]WKV72471.1 DUF3152 domain-containing protein [Streptomyces sp. PCS3-D2]
MPAGHSTGRSRRDGPRARRRAARRRRLRRTILLGSAALVAVSATAYALVPEDGTSTDAKGRAAARPDEPGAGGTDAAGNPLPQGGAKSPEAEPSPAASAQQSASPQPSTDAPATPGKPGAFAGSSASGGVQGKGTARRWRLEVEEGSGVDPEAAARSVEAILGDPRGWTKDPRYGFQLVGAGQPVDFTVKIASPRTTDMLCDVVTPELIGETNCRVGHTVVVNLKRWKEGSPQFSGTVEEYRALIVNHEVGHEIGRGHEGCPGPGKPAPAMMQQIKGLGGCKSNAWPFDAEGTYLSGPPVL